MLTIIDTVQANTRDQGYRSQKLFTAVVLAALDDAIEEDRARSNGQESIKRWANSRDGREVLNCAGIEATQRAINGMMEFVARGVRTSVALSQGNKEE